jgi:hypothetical protein
VIRRQYPDGNGKEKIRPAEDAATGSLRMVTNGYTPTLITPREFLPTQIGAIRTAINGGYSQMELVNQ